MINIKGESFVWKLIKVKHSFCVSERGEVQNFQSWKKFVTKANSVKKKFAIKNSLKKALILIFNLFFY